MVFTSFKKIKNNPDSRPLFLKQTVKGVSREMFKTGVIFLNRGLWLIKREIRQTEGSVRVIFRAIICFIFEKKPQNGGFFKPYVIIRIYVL